MAEANKDEVDKCKKIAAAAMSNGDSEKAVRFLEKAMRMAPGDSSLAALLEQAKSGPSTAAPPPQASSEESRGPRMRAQQSAGSDSRATSGGARVNKEGKEYTPEMAQMVQKVLRCKDYYELLGVQRNAAEDECKKAYRKLALKLHPDKCHAPGAEEAFKKLSKAFQCLSDPDRKSLYDQYGDEERVPQHHRHAHHQDFMAPEDLFAAFFGQGAFFQGHPGQHRQQHHEQDPEAARRAQLFQMLPVLLLVVLTLASNLGGRDGAGRFSFQPQGSYQFERTSRTLGATYYVAQDFEEHYQEGTKSHAQFEQQVEIYYIRQKHSDCDYQEQVMYKKVMVAKRRGTEEDVKVARNHPRPACKELERVKRRHQNLYRQALYAVR